MLVIALVVPKLTKLIVNEFVVTAEGVYTPLAILSATGKFAIVDPASDRNMLSDVPRPCANDVVNTAVESTELMVILLMMMDPYST